MILFKLNHTSRYRPKQTEKPRKNNKLATRTNMINIRKEAIDNENNNPNNTAINFCFFVRQWFLFMNTQDRFTNPLAASPD
ncbi:hypothetical protein DQT12_03950 [Salmonella enterica subsp. enterica serovar Reading]|nr:hypothetical protein [Salmonella enterica subsp. enterica serovar Reading]